MEERLQIIDIANKSFGETGWSFSIPKVDLDYVDDNHSGEFSAGTTAVVRVERSNGVYREDVGYGVSSGPNKAEVISKAKKDAVTDGLKGAVMNFGGDIARKVNSVTPNKPGKEKASSSCQEDTVPNIPGISPPQASFQPCQVSRNISEKTRASRNQYTAVLTVPASSAVVDREPTRIAPLPRLSSPLAKPLPQPINSDSAQLSDEELAKMERKRRQRHLQEEFRKKHLMEQAQAQSKAQSKEPSNGILQEPRVPLKEQQQFHCQSKDSNVSKDHAANTLDADDDVLISTQDIEAIVEIAANNTNMSRRSPMLSSPSIARPSSASKSHSKLSTGYKRPDLSNYAFNQEKKAKNIDT